jgi:hypothetical protein
MENQPTGFFRNLIDSLYQAATRYTNQSCSHNYQRLLIKLTAEATAILQWSTGEHWPNPDYRDVIQKTIVKHPATGTSKRRCYLATIPQCAEKRCPGVEEI